MKKERLASNSKAVGGGQRLCFVPHACRFLGRQSLGVELTVMASAAGFTQSDRRKNSACAVALKW